MRRRVGRTLAGEGYVEVLNFPFIGEADLDRLGTRRRRLPSYDAAAGQPAQQRRAADDHHAAARPAPHGRAQRQPRHQRPGPLRDRTRSRCRTRASARRSCPVDRRPTEGEWDDLNKALPDQPLHLAFALCGDRDRAGWWGDGRPAGWSDVIETARVVADALGLELTVRAGEPGALAPRPLRRAAARRDHGRPRRRAAPQGVPGVRRTRPHLGRRARPRRPARARRHRAERPATLSAYPVAKEDVALVVADDLPAEELAATLREGAGPLCESVRLFDVYTGQQVGEGRKSLAFALRFRAPDRTLTEKETAAAGDAAVALAGAAARRRAARLTAAQATRPRTAHARAEQPDAAVRLGVHDLSRAPTRSSLAAAVVQRGDVRRRRSRARRGTATRSRRSPRRRSAP